MRIEEFDPAADDGKVDACYQMYAAGLPYDDPDGPPMSEHLFSAWMHKGWSGERRETALAADSGGVPVGGYLLELPDRRNTHMGELTVMVGPARRRQGCGAALLRHAAECAAAHDRNLLSAQTRRGSPGSAFASAMGARAGVVEVRRVLELAGIPDGKLTGLRGAAEAAARGYSLLFWRGGTPEEHLDEVARVSAAMADAPHNPGEEEYRPDLQRIRDSERRAAEIGIRRYAVAARYDRTGELAGLTEIGVEADDPSWGYQFITAVVREHRGHRLGLLVKLAMLDLLAEAEPALRRILTENADSNQHMIGINAALGFEVLDEWQSWELDVAAVPQGRPAQAEAR
jgi:RimJ/RimL family protein N-acetyltransferase